MVITLLALIFKQYVYTHPYLDVNVCCIFRLPSWGGPLDVTPRLLLVTSLLYSIGFPPRKKGHTIARVIFPDAWVTWAVFVDRVTVLFTWCSSLRNGSTVPLLTLICLNWNCNRLVLFRIIFSASLLRRAPYGAVCRCICVILIGLFYCFV